MRGLVTDVRQMPDPGVMLHDPLDLLEVGAGTKPMSLSRSLMSGSARTRATSLLI
jgi:hypothetical protein